MSKALLRRQRGVTLVELVISIVIISIAMVAVLNSFSFSISQSADPLWRNKTLKLAQLYLDEILAKNYDDATPVGGLPEVTSPSCIGLGPEAGETRATYNDVDDYNGTVDMPPVSLVGSLDSSYNSYIVSVKVECDGNTVGATGGTPDNHAKKISVEVTPPGQNGIVFAV
ncbi:MAG: prepilin-type N-terminal cleavage/methylation domain-containing protein, partial [Oleiphilaceae bacterium]|nr:prepilin-type N-terminal cleavage/methylation domain-containing protein [Oleiphilaceae bacterium]